MNGTNIKKTSRILIALTLVLAFVVGAFGFPGFMLGTLRQTEPERKPDETWYMTPEQRGTLIKGNSSAFRIEASPHVTIYAEENALDMDRTFTMTPYDPESMEYLSEMSASSPGVAGTPLMAWELDAGLEDDEMLPGVFNMEFDLGALGVFPEFYDDIVPYRINDAGEWFPLSYQCRDGILTARSNQNSAVALLISGFKIAVTAYSIVLMSYETVSDYLFVGGNSEEIIYVKSIHDKDLNVFTLHVNYTHNTINDLKRRRGTIYGEVYEKNRNELMNAAGLANLRYMPSDPKVGEKIAQIIQQARLNTEKELTENSEYQELEAQIASILEEQYKKMQVPSVVQDLQWVYEYYRQAGMEMPGICIPIYLTDTPKDEKSHGLTDSNLTPGANKAWVVLNAKKLHDTQDSKDNMLSTVAHEYYHVLQRMKRNRFLSCIKYDEATALVCEIMAYKQFEKEHKAIMHKEPRDFENAELWDLYGMPLNTDSGNVSFGDVSYSFSAGEDGVNAGYPIAHMILYYFEKYGKMEDLTPVKMLEAYDWSFVRIAGIAPSTTEMLCNLFGISEADFNDFYEQFIWANQEQIRRKSPDKYDDVPYENAWAFPKSAAEPVATVELERQHYSTRVRRIKAGLPNRYTGDYDLLFVKEKDLVQNLPNLKLMPIEAGGARPSCVETKYGLLLMGTASGPSVVSSQKYYMTEMFSAEAGFWEKLGNWWNGGNVPSGKTGHYKIYTLIAPDLVNAEVKGDTLSYLLPKPDRAMQDGYMDGMRVTITPSGNGTNFKPYVEYIKKSGAGKRRAVKLEKIIPRNMIDQAQTGVRENERIQFTISVCEYINEKAPDGRVYRVLGPESKPLSEANALLAEMGAQSGKVEIALYWQSTDDLDLHCITPDGSHIYYANSMVGGGHLDVDMNVNEETARPGAVEHIRFADPESGTYRFYIENYTDRTDGDTPTEIWVSIDSNEPGQNDESKKRIIMKKSLSMGDRSETWQFVINKNTNPETGQEYIDGAPAIEDDLDN